MPSKTTTRSTGIYVQSITPIDTTEGLKRHAQSLSDAFDIKAVLTGMESHIRSRLKAFGCIFNAGPVRRTNVPSGYTLRRFGLAPESPTAPFSDVALNTVGMERAIEALGEIVDIRAALRGRHAADAALAGIRLGRVFERLEITPHESNAALGRADRQSRRKGTAKGNATKMREAANRKSKIIASYTRNKTTGWGRKKSSYANIADALQCSESTVKRVMQDHSRQQRNGTKR
jgi:hypothetical protein